MLKDAIGFVVNRLIIIGAILLFLNAYVRDSCHRSSSYFGTVERAFQGFRELERAFQ